MITREQIPAVLDHPVHDRRGKKIGDAKHVFLDDATGRPEWVSVKTGLFGTNESFVPIHEANLVEDHLEVPYDKDMVKDAPNVDVDSGGHLSEQEEHRLYEHYGIDWDAAWQDANAPGAGGWAHSDREQRTGTEMEADTGGWEDTEPRLDAGIGTGSEGRAAQEPPTADAPPGYRGPGADDAMTRSEERMHVGKERRETGRARLRKYVVTEEEQRTVPVSREEVRVEREPITDANRESAVSGPEITESEHEVTLHEERPVVETRTEPVERVRLDTEEHTEEEPVRGEVRKERIEADTPDEPGRGDRHS
ncbi:PRC and DUF2382 domain-containing protein [Streptomyces calidiresistens]|uniref:DUF2382 domain-containing protein n=1 Tax=Streptomyces calidiresistens TaxID=1485586 RepID=A0A7W3T6D0_9ACTN|nr:DUF2382 domain-containing protein [Streptomyces calidiresistens]MBB0231571.1 DUF2382 domain-containing protein [Streptomyces calidiresistens]